MSLAPGTRLGPYEILSSLGVGGMGEVWKAKDPKLGRFVAIKVLPAMLAKDAEALARFEREAKAMAALQHPNVLGIFDFGMEQGITYAVMELMEGETLRQLIARGPIPQRQALEIGIQVAKGMAAAHDKGVIHRDLKPENLFLQGDGRVRILDFGLAKAVFQADAEITGGIPVQGLNATRPGMILGTAAYMSPEQIRGQDLDGRSDLFSFGAVLVEMLTGKPAFQGDTAADLFSAILKKEAPRLWESGIQAPGLERVVRHCLEKRKEDRFRTAQDLAFDLETLSLSSEAMPAMAVTQHLAGPPPQGEARFRIPWKQGLGLVGVLLMGIFLGRWLPERALPASHPTLRHLTYSGRDTSPAASPNGGTVAFCSDRDGRPRIWLKQLSGGGEVALTEGPDDFPRFSPDGAWILFTRTTGPRSDLFKIPTLGGETRKLVEDAADGDWSPDGSRIVFMRWKEEGERRVSIIGVAGADGNTPKELASLRQSRLLAHPRWSPDGKLLALSGGAQQAAEPQSILLVDVDGSGMRSLAPPKATGYVSAVAWRSADSLLYMQAESVVGDSAGSSGRLIAQDIRSGKSEFLMWSPNNCQVLDIAGKGRLVFDARSPRQNLRELPLSGKGGDRWLSKGNGTDRQPVYSPDGQWVTFSSNRAGNLDLWSLSTTTGAVRHVTDDPAEDWDPGYTPDGRHLLWSSNRGGSFEIWMANADGSAARQVSRDGGDAENPTATPDGAWIVYKSGNPKYPGLWKIRADGRDAQRLVEGTIALPEVSPDGRHALYRESTGPRRFAIRVVRLEDGALEPFQILVDVMKVTPATLGRARWMPGGRAIAFTAQDAGGVNGVFVQAFTPGQDTTPSRRPLGGFDPDRISESFGLSPDGSRLAIAGWEQLFSLMGAEGVEGVLEPASAKR